MSAAPDTLGTPFRTAPALPMLIRQAWAEMLQQIRMPMGLVWSLVATSVLFLFIGFGWAGQDVAGIDGKTYMMASFGAFGTFNIMLGTFGGGIASDRSARRHVLYRAMPVPPAVLLGAKVLVACSMTAVMTTFLVCTAVATGTRLDPLMAVSLIGRMAIGGIPFITMGLAIGYLVRPASVAVAINILSLGLSFLSGIYFPIPETGGSIQRVANWSPMYHLAELGRDAVGAQVEHSIVNTVGVLLIYTLVFGLLALRAYGREEKRTFE